MGHWRWPLPYETPDVPLPPHPGAFGVVRKHDVHTGVDLYTRRGARVEAVESGIVVSVEPFTGEHAGSPWWNQTWAVLIEGPSGVVCYGEIYPYMELGRQVKQGQLVGYVEQVLSGGGERPDIQGHRLSMLHMELYENGTVATIAWQVGEPLPGRLQDPTYSLLSARASL